MIIIDPLIHRRYLFFRSGQLDEGGTDDNGIYKMEICYQYRQEYFTFYLLYIY